MILTLALGVLVATGTASADELQRRWDQPETPYEDRNMAAKVGSNVRDGILGIVDSGAQGVMSAFTLVSRGGFVVRKVSTIVGDVVGLVDNNIATKYVFRGIISRQFLRLGDGANGVVVAIGDIHDSSFTPPGLTQADYIGDEMFHTRVYLEPSVLAMTGAVVISDVIIRPVGGLITIFGLRSQGEQLDEYGLDLVERSTKVKFF